MTATVSVIPSARQSLFLILRRALAPVSKDANCQQTYNTPLVEAKPSPKRSSRSTAARSARANALKQLSTMSTNELLEARFARLMAYGRTKEQALR